MVIEVGHAQPEAAVERRTGSARKGDRKPADHAALN
jgi:hypothetical protein